MTLSEVHVKYPVILIGPAGDRIEVDCLMRGQVRQMVRLQGKVLGCCVGWLGGKSLCTNRSLKFLARL